MCVCAVGCADPPTSHLNSVIVKYRDLSYLIDLLATDKSRYFAQPRPTIVKYLLYCVNVEKVQSTD